MLFCVSYFPNRNLFLRVLILIKRKGTQKHTKREAARAAARPRIAVALSQNSSKCFKMLQNASKRQKCLKMLKNASKMLQKCFASKMLQKCFKNASKCFKIASKCFKNASNQNTIKYDFESILSRF